MTPASLFLIAVSGLAVFWLGFFTALLGDLGDEVGPFVGLPAAALNVAAVGTALWNLYHLIAQNL